MHMDRGRVPGKVSLVDSRIFLLGYFVKYLKNYQSAGTLNGLEFFYH
jgi:hypothetical protein